MKRFHLAGFLIIAMGLTGCGAKDPNEGLTAKQIYTKADAALKNKDYTAAIKQYEALDSTYPFSAYSDRALLNSVYAYYQNEDYASAGAVAQRFIHLYPRHQNVDYAYYMKGLSNFEQDRGVFAKVFPLDASWRDIGTQEQAYQDFAQLITRYPDSPYAGDARQHMVYLRNQVAQKELNVAEFYYDRKYYVASANRAGFIVQNYPQAPQSRNALILLAKADQALGVNKPAQDAERVLAASSGK